MPESTTVSGGRMGTTCKYAESCALFMGEADIDHTLEEALRERYCYTGNVACARRKVREVLGRESIPLDLLPTEHERAEKIICKRS